MKLIVIALVCFSACLAENPTQSAEICAKELDVDLSTYSSDNDPKCIILCAMRRQQVITGECNINFKKIHSGVDAKTTAKCLERTHDDDCCKRVIKLRSCIFQAIKDREPSK